MSNDTHPMKKVVNVFFSNKKIGFHTFFWLHYKRQKNVILDYLVNALTNFLIDFKMRPGLLSWLNFGSPTCNLFLEERRLLRISVLWRKLTWRNRNLSNHPVILFHQSVSFLLGFPKISWNFLWTTWFAVWGLVTEFKVQF